jgi:hypothetical protein
VLCLDIYGDTVTLKLAEKGQSAGLKIDGRLHIWQLPSGGSRLYFIKNDMSLVENIARRNSSALELLQSIKYLKSQGYADDAIAVKTNLGKDYIRGIIRLLEEGEEYLVNAVEKGRIPLCQTLNIAAEDDTAVQTALTEAYESGALTGKKLVVLQKIISRRKHYVLVAESYIEKMQGLVKLSPELKADVITTACRVHMKETPNSTEVNPELIRYLLMLPR